ncbi:Eukaryotic translation initiation factor 1A, X-chromosomal [Galemys pyrenaicus]|uniref:Eukaryotic translation initiation factor 4C n=1 Tax=Galemys pyrenaicus TaxID=202257 RepID=A0A8J6AQQ9_GALPY|nr:Eukaryotic translation initiation factor 1A, X-chromosomal [Galemys pyrenaicus]
MAPFGLRPGDRNAAVGSGEELGSCSGKGGKNRRRGKNENESEKRELVFKEDGQEYAQVIKMLGNGRLEAMCFDGVKRLCHIRGKLRKKDNKADVILKYNADEARSLKAYGELPEHGNVSMLPIFWYWFVAKINETDTFGPGDDDEIQFDDIGDDDEDIDDAYAMSSCGDPGSLPELDCVKKVLELFPILLIQREIDIKKMSFHLLAAY